MAVKHYVDEIPPSGGRTYNITTSGGKSTITDTTVYQQVGTTFGAADVNSTCVLECNYVKMGSLHYLTTGNTSSENIKFYATSDFHKGDIFNFNGEILSAKTSDGLELGEKFFVANTMVECRRRGNTLYFSAQSKSIFDFGTGDSYHFGFDNGLMYIEED